MNPIDPMDQTAPQTSVPQQGSVQQNSPWTGASRQNEPQPWNPQTGVPQQGSVQQNSPWPGASRQSEPQPWNPQTSVPQQGVAPQNSPWTGASRQSEPQPWNPQASVPQQGIVQQNSPWPGVPQQSSGQAPAFQAAFPPAKTKDPRRVGAARAFNRMSLVTLLQFLAAFALEIPLIWLTALLGVDIYRDGMAFQWLEAVMVPLSTALPFLLFLVLSRRDPSAYLRFERVEFMTGLLCVLAGLAVCLLANYPALFIEDLLSGVGYAPAENALREASSLPEFALEMAVTAVLVPVMEEFAFRGVLLSHLRPFGSGFAIVGSALVFSLVHLDFSNVIFALVAGLVFGFLYDRTGNLWVSIAIHSLNNALAVFGNDLDLFFPPETADLVDSGLLAVPLAVGAVALILLLIFKRDQVFSRPAPQEGAPRPLGAGESAVAMVKSPIFWVLAVISLLYTLSLIL